MITKIIDKKILYVEYPNNKELNLATYRSDSFWEGDPSLVGRKFSTDEWLDTISDDNGNFNIYEWQGVMQGYLEYWDGMNMSLTDFNRFVKKFNGELSQREKDVKKFADKLDRGGYIIYVATGGLVTTLRHEFAHAFAYVYPEYKKSVQAIVDSITPEIKDKFIRGLAMSGYNPDVYNDEIQAYIVGYDPIEYQSYFPELTPEEVQLYFEQITAIFDVYYNKANCNAVNC